MNSQRYQRAQTLGIDMETDRVDPPDKDTPTVKAYQQERETYRLESHAGAYLSMDIDDTMPVVR